MGDLTLAERLRKAAPYGDADELWPEVCAVVEACQGADHNKQGDALIALAKRMDEEGL